MSPVDISLLKKLAVLKLILKTKQILLPLQLWRSTSARTQSCGMPVPARFVSLPALTRCCYFFCFLELLLPFFLSVFWCCLLLLPAATDACCY